MQEQPRTPRWSYRGGIASRRVVLEACRRLERTKKMSIGREVCSQCRRRVLKASISFYETRGDLRRKRVGEKGIFHAVEELELHIDGVPLDRTLNQLTSRSISRPLDEE